MNRQAVRRSPGLLGLALILAPALAWAGILDSFSDIGQRLGVVSSERKFIPADEAFIPSVTASDGRTISVHWQIADGYYLYRRNFGFAIPSGAVRLGEPVFAHDGKIKDDPSFGRLEVYTHAIDVTVQVERGPGPSLPLEIEIAYQGCAEQGFCYPPIRKTIPVVLPALDGAALASTASSPGRGAVDDGALPEQQRIVRSLQHRGLWLNMGMLFVAGLLLAFTPCVLPMLPILSAVIIGRGQGREPTPGRALALSASYVLAMSLMYTAAGVVAGLFGANLQAVFQEPWVLSVFSLFFVLLALSMFGLYEIQMPTAIQGRLDALSRRQRSGSLVGAAVMGLLSALIVGPCVAAPLAGILIYIGLQGDAWVGGLSLFAMSLGMGLPLLLFGVSAGRLMPHVRHWMPYIRPVFGVMMLGLAIWLLQRIVPDTVAMLLWAVLVIGVAVYMGALDRLESGAGGWQRLGRTAAVILLSWGIMMLVGVATGGHEVWRPLAALAAMQRDAPAARSLRFEDIKGAAGLDAAIASAGGRPVMVDFYADWCVDCKRMEANAFSDPRVVALLGRARLLQADVTANDAKDQALLHRYRLFGPPAILFFDARGRELERYRLVGYLSPDEFLMHARKAIEAGA